MYGFMLYCICSMPHHRVSTWYLILLVLRRTRSEGLTCYSHLSVV
jgi:hypothetical protein